MATKDVNGEQPRRRQQRSKKAHIEPPPRQFKPRVKPGADEKEIGQFIGAGSPGREKK
jgi:hypothetical protein